MVDKELLQNLPGDPGVYIMKDKTGKVIYVGKAKVLKNRVRQYFQNTERHAPKVAAMVSHVDTFEYILTDSELEALILECNLIKKYRPYYNILLKDDKNYPYIKVTTNEEYPRIRFVRRMQKDGAKYFGPYSGGAAVREAMDLACKLFQIPTCEINLPKDLGKKRACINAQIGRCCAPCEIPISKEEYTDYKAKYTRIAENAKEGIRVLKEKLADVLENRSERNRWISHFTQFSTMETLDRKAVVHMIQSIKVIGKKELEITFTYQDEYQKAIQLIQLAEQTSQRKVG